MSGERLRSLNGGNHDTDEWYTQYEDVDRELSHYTAFLMNKTVYLPCDREDSAFVKWFKDHDELGCTVWRTEDDFRLPKNIELMKKADVIITNPPFSKIKEFLIPLLENNKKFIVITMQISLSYSGIMPYYANGQVRVGHTIPQYFIDPSGERKRNGQCIWATSISGHTEYRAIPYSHKSDSDYPRDIKTGAIFVQSAHEIPNTREAMLVPVSIPNMLMFNPDEYYICPHKIAPYVMENGEIKQKFQRMMVKKKQNF